MALRQNVLTMCWPNRTDQGTLTGGSWRAALPLDNLKSRVIAKKARTTGTLLDDPSSTNLFLRSAEFDNAYWTKIHTTVTVDATTAPDNTVTADRISETAVTDTHLVICAVEKVASPKAYTFSIYLKAAERSVVYLRLAGSGSNGCYAAFDLAAGTAGVPVGIGGTFSVESATITLAANGFYRCSITAITDNSATLRCYLYLSNGITALGSYAGDVTKGVYAWGAQLENSLEPTAYIPTTTTAVTRTNPSTIDLALDSGRPICAVALAGHNCSSLARWRVRFYSDYAQSSLLYDSTRLSVWPSSYANEQLEWEDDNFWLGNDTLDVSSDFTPLAVLFSPDIISGVRSVKIEIFDPLNAAGYVDVGRLFVSTAWQPAINMDYGVSFGYQNSTAVETARDGTEYFDRRRQRRTMNFTLSGLSPAEAFSGIYAMQRDIGTDREFLIAYELAPSEQFYYRTFLARLQELDALTQPYFDRYSVPMQAREIL